jgi:hypothetical protein
MNASIFVSVFWPANTAGSLQSGGFVRALVETGRKRPEGFNRTDRRDGPAAVRSIRLFSLVYAICGIYAVKESGYGRLAHQKTAKNTAQR